MVRTGLVSGLLPKKTEQPKIDLEDEDNRNLFVIKVQFF